MNFLKLQEYTMIYYIVINLYAFISMYIDKKRAIKNKWRIPEKTLFLIGILGGVFGIYAGMKWIRHKVRHKLFSLGVPIMIIFYSLLFNYLFILV